MHDSFRSCSPAYANDWRELVAQADVWFHGHVHTARQYRVGSRGRVVCNPVGRPSDDTGFDPHLVVEV